MDNLLLSIRVVLPLFLMMVIGYLLRQRNLWDDKTLSVMNNVCFRIFLPVMLFLNIYQTDIADVFNPKLILFSAVSVIILFSALFFIVPSFEKMDCRRGVLIQGMYRSNFILFGMPVTIALLGEGNAGCTSVLIAVIIPIFNVLAVFVLEYFCGEKSDYKKVFKGILTNPLIWGALIGGLFKMLNIAIPLPVETTLKQISGLATPLALLILGGSFHFQKVSGYLKQLTAAVTTRLFVIPAIFLPIGIMLGFRGAELIALLTLFGSPAAVSSFTMACQMGGDSELAGQIVVFSSAFSVLSMFIWIFIFKQYQFI